MLQHKHQDPGVSRTLQESVARMELTTEVLQEQLMDQAELLTEVQVQPEAVRLPELLTAPGQETQVRQEQALVQRRKAELQVQRVKGKQPPLRDRIVQDLVQHQE